VLVPGSQPVQPTAGAPAAVVTGNDLALLKASPPPQALPLLVAETTARPSRAMTSPSAVAGEVHPSAALRARDCGETVWVPATIALPPVVEPPPR
jgi:hypothetical protein